MERAKRLVIAATAILLLVPVGLAQSPTPTPEPSATPEPTPEPTPTPPPEPPVTGPRAGAMAHVAWGELDDAVGFADYAVGGIVIADEIRYAGAERPEIGASTDGNRMVVDVDGDRFSILDHETGLLTFRPGDEGSRLVFTFPASAAVTQLAAGARIQVDGREALFLSDDVAWAGSHIASTSAFASLHLVVERPAPSGAEEDPRPSIRTAIEDKRVAAEIAVGGQATDLDGIDVLAYDDIEVTVVGSTQKFTPDAPLRIVTASELEAGRTIVINVDEERLVGRELVLRYYNVHANGHETEVIFPKADSLADVLDPSDAQPEWWAVWDDDGLHILVSHPAFSVHAVTLGSLADIVTPSVLAGIMIGGAAIAVAGTAMFWPRRRRL